jgi:hypothetical protein
MTELQQAAQQALKILDSEFTTLDGEFCRWCDGRLNAKHNCALEQTITALRAALATQSTHSADCYKWHHECAIAEVESLREELAEAYTEMRKMTEQVESAEPVAWVYVNSDGECEQIEYETPPDDPSVTPLYLHPKTLTDEDISVLWYQSGEQPFKFARMLLK